MGKQKNQGLGATGNHVKDTQQERRNGTGCGGRSVQGAGDGQLTAGFNDDLGVMSDSDEGASEGMEADGSDSEENGRGQAWEKGNTQHLREFCCKGEQGNKSTAEGDGRLNNYF